ncbi:GGDEF domain-containing protein [Longispora albida]|uniref:GGDEF domain-containing protein n=1 Tax=Longispora albida TaxID=203523 RepID=UPI00036866F7|nr:GGDEF domain-containing protein [Longispora albida]
MRPAGDEEQWRADYARLRDLMTQGRPSDATRLARRIIATAGDPFRQAQAWLFEFGGKINRRDGPGVLAAQAAAHDALAQCPEPRLHGEFHALAAWYAYELGSIERCGMHLVSSERELSRMTETGQAAVDAWHDLAVTYSVVGFHDQAHSALDRGRAAAEASGLDMWACGGMEVAVRHALWLDHGGDSASCTKILRDVLGMLPGDLSGVAVIDQSWFEYAARRLDVLGSPSGVRVAVPVHPDSDSRELSDLLVLAEVCDLITTGRPAEAAALLARTEIGEQTAGPAEAGRLKALALMAAGDHAGALEAERTATRAVLRRASQLAPLFLDSLGALIDQDHLRRSIAWYADAAFTDPLTGLPNRRRVDEFVADLAARRCLAMVGVLDLDAFKAVNDTHGHLAGDLVLQRVAGILARCLRRGDLLARCGGDEFIIVLPATTSSEAAQIGARITAAVAGEDWDALLPGTPVSISVGWAPMDPVAGLAPAFDLADGEMYRVKRRVQAEHPAT